MYKARGKDAGVVLLIAPSVAKRHLPTACAHAQKFSKNNSDKNSSTNRRSQAALYTLIGNGWGGPLREVDYLNFKTQVVEEMKHYSLCFL